MKEEIFEYLFSPPYFLGGGGENKFKYIFTPVHWGEKINLDLFSLPFITMDQVRKRKKNKNKNFTIVFFLGGGGKYIQIYFHSRLLGKENIFKFIFTSVFLGEKIYLNLFSPPYFGGENKFKFIFTPVYLGEKIYIFSRLL